MKTNRTMVYMIFMVAAAAFLAGCSVARDQETVGEYVDDSVITTRVKTALAKDEDTSAVNIKVKTMEGGIVQLSGFAKSGLEKRRAGEIARDVKGVVEVHNDLVIQPGK